MNRTILYRGIPDQLRKELEDFIAGPLLPAIRSRLHKEANLISVLMTQVRVGLAGLRQAGLNRQNIWGRENYLQPPKNLADLLHNNAVFFLTKPKKVIRETKLFWRQRAVGKKEPAGYFLHCYCNDVEWYWGDSFFKEDRSRYTLEEMLLERPSALLRVLVDDSWKFKKA